MVFWGIQFAGCMKPVLFAWYDHALYKYLIWLIDRYAQSCVNKTVIKPQGHFMVMRFFVL